MTSFGETHLETLLARMQPILRPEVFVFAACPPSVEVSALKPTMVFEEEEGTTVIVLEKTAAAFALDAHFPCQMITLGVHSSLEACGFLAHICTRLAALKIPTNAVSALRHDHLFVPASSARQALEALEDMVSHAASSALARH